MNVKNMFKIAQLESHQNDMQDDIIMTGLHKMMSL